MKLFRSSTPRRAMAALLLLSITLSDASELGGLMDEAAYKAFIEGL